MRRRESTAPSAQERQPGADPDVVGNDQRERLRLSPAARAAWTLGIGLAVVGGFIAWLALGLSLCEEDFSPGSDRYCGEGGWEASGLVFAVLAISTATVPAVGVLLGRRRLFWAGVVGPILLGLLTALISATAGTR